MSLGVRLTLLEMTTAFVAAALSYRFIERPFLQHRYQNPGHAEPVKSI
jgi:peptidoglycan/LPS O-acetylase OafA/YrhL